MESIMQLTTLDQENLMNTDTILVELLRTTQQVLVDNKETMTELRSAVTLNSEATKELVHATNEMRVGLKEVREDIHNLASHIRDGCEKCIEAVNIQAEKAPSKLGGSLLNTVKEVGALAAGVATLVALIGYFFIIT